MATTWLLFVILVMVGAYDIYAGWMFGNDATISVYVLLIARRWPVLPLIVGLVLGHLFWPQSPPSQTVADSVPALSAGK